MAFDITPAVEVDRDVANNVVGLSHLTQPYTGPALNARDLASAYTAEVADVYNFEPTWLEALESVPGEQVGTNAIQLRFSQADVRADTSTVSFQETCLDLPVWEAGFTVFLINEPLRVTGSRNSVHYEIQVTAPRRNARCMPNRMTAAHLREVLALKDAGSDLKVTAARLWIYQFFVNARTGPTSEHERSQAVPLQGSAPTLPLPPVPPDIVDGNHYVVSEVVFTLSVAGFRDLVWRALVEVETCAVLYLRPLVAACTGSVFLADPVATTGNATLDGCTAAATLDPLRTDVALNNLTPATPQFLIGANVSIVDDSSPAKVPPSVTPPPCDFTYSSTDQQFAAVNAYHHVDQCFSLVAAFGYSPVTNFFQNTTLPVPTYYFDENDVNAHTWPNSSGVGLNKFTFGLAHSGCPVGIAADQVVILHEFVHGMLMDRIHSGFLGFAHNGGDAFGVIYRDPTSLAPDRYLLVPWIPEVPRRFDRKVADGWAFGGSQDDSVPPGGPMYQAEQILTTALFRVYLSTCGGSMYVDKRQFASQYILYVMTHAMASLPIASTQLTTAQAYAAALMAADAAAPATFNGTPGGTIGKVVRWGFEKQGLYQPPGAPTPVSTAGAPPAVDVYVNDTYYGEYPFVEDFWDNTNIWNLLSPDPSTTPADHQTPIVGQTNYAYVYISNRGTQAASNVVVSAYHCRPSAGLTWPDDWQAMTTPSIAVPGPLNPGSQVRVGPFEWTPSEIGHECMLMSVSATGDLSNADVASGLPCASGPTPHWRLVPFDNNIGQRNVAPVAGGGGITGLAASFGPKRFWANNPSASAGHAAVQAILPAFLVRKGWAIQFVSPGGSAFTLGPRASREVQFRLQPGEDFTADDVRQAGDEARIILRLLIDNVPVGGMTYQIDPNLKSPPHEHRGMHPAPPEHCSPEAKRLLECLEVPTEDIASVRIKRITIDIDFRNDCP